MSSWIQKLRETYEEPFSTPGLLHREINVGYPVPRVATSRSGPTGIDVKVPGPGTFRASPVPGLNSLTYAVTLFQSALV